MGRRRFLSAIQGSSAAVTRLGTADSGIRAQAQGWDSGVLVTGHAERSQDVFGIYLTGGSNGDHPAMSLGELKQAPSGKRFFHLSDEAIDAIRLGTNVIELDD